MWAITSLSRYIPHTQRRYFSSSRVSLNVPNINETIKAAATAFESYRLLPKKDVTSFLNSVADNLEADRPAIVKLASKETSLPSARCEGELTRTTNQLKLFAKLVEEGSWVDARLEGSVRSMLVPIGPVAVFGASNFPLAFSTLGGDTASALAAKCTVVYKTHPGHPETTLKCNEAIQKSIKSFSLPPGVFQIIPAAPNSLTTQLVEHPLIQGVGFTGSQHVGTIIFKAATNRKHPIPVYCEMGSVNPIFVLPDALKTKNDDIAQGLAGSVTQGVGQFCTNPGLVFLLGSTSDIDHFITSLTKSVSSVPPAKMLTQSIFNSYTMAVDSLVQVQGIKLECRNAAPEDQAGAAVFSVSMEDFLSQHERLQQEIFGPTTLLVKVPNVSEIGNIADILEGQLTATFHGTDKDLGQKNFLKLVDSMSQRVGRILWGGFPTGVEVNSAMQHGGPWPATSDGRSSSVGTRAIYRWVRPLAFQTFPEQLLPSALVKSNPENITRLEDGKLVLKS